jgi:hypothetical protein
VRTDAVMRESDAIADPEERMRRLLGTVIGAASRSRAEMSLLAHADHPLVAPVLVRVAERRIEYVAKLFGELGFPPDTAHSRALLAYSAFLGHTQLAHATPQILPAGAEARSYLDAVVAALLAR